MYGWEWLYLERDKMLPIYGEGALEYLHFQRYLILFSFVISLISVVIVFPVNVLIGHDKDFSNYAAGINI